MAEKELDPRRQLFIDNFMELSDAGAAVMASGYFCKDKVSAQALGWQILQNPLVSAEIKRRQAELRAQARFSREECLEELEMLAFCDFKKLQKQKYDGVAPNIKLAALEMYIRLMGFETDGDTKRGNNMAVVVKGLREALRRKNGGKP